MKTFLRTQNVAFIALACGVGATLFAWFLAGRQVEREAQAEFAGRAHLAASTLERRIQRYIDVLYGLEALAYHDPTLSRSEFFRYVSALELGRRFPEVQAVAFIRRVPDAQREEFVARVRDDRTMRATGYPQFDIRPEGRRDEYWVIDFVENEGVFGLDIRTRAGALEAAERARDTGEASVTSRYRLVQEKGTSFGLVLYLAVYALDRPQTAAARRESLRGFVNVVLRANDMLADLLNEPVISGLRMQVHDVGSVGGAAMAASNKTLFYPMPAAAGNEPAPSWIQWQRQYEENLAVAGRQWQLRFHDDPSLSPWLRRLPLLAFLAGMSVTLLLFGILYTIARTRSEAVALAARATRDLRTQLAFTHQLEADTREINEKLRAVIHAAPLAIIARDLNGVIATWNPAADRMFGWKEDEVLNTDTSIVPQRLREETTGLRRRAEAGETIWIAETQRQHRDGRLVDVSMSIAPIYGAEGQVSGTMVTITDISRRKQAEAALRESESHLRLAMEAGQMGMWYWECDTDRFNYSEGLNVLFGLPAESPRVDYRVLQERLHPDDRELIGATLRHCLKHGADFQVDYRVVWPDGSVRWVANRAQVHRGPDGRAQRLVGVAMDITERKIAEQRIAHMAHHDALTGLPNRVLLRDRIQQAIAQAHRNGTQLAVLFLDLDRFKTINDSLGHQLGDRLLQSVASRILVCVREGDTVSRVGGDEFVIVIPGIGSSVDASSVASKILEVLASAFHLHGNDLRAEASIGISLYPADGSDAETLMRNADAAMYHAKDSGRGNFQFFTQHMNVAAQQRLNMENALRRAVENREFELHYQPLFDLRDRSITGFEALVRWHTPEGELLSPSKFIAAAEESGLIVPIGEWVLREALKQAKTWQSPGRALSISVNVSANQLSRSSFVERLRHLVLETGIDPARIELEVTESVIIEGAGAARAALDQVAALGVGIAIDDFGTGYSGLAYLKQLPINTVKIDQSFVRDLTIDPDDAAIVTAIVAMARSLGVDVVAEGVEAEEQLEELKRLGCHRAQGYLLARPMNAAAVAKLLARASAAAAAD